MKLSTKRRKIDLWDIEKERCINCRMMDASQLCSMKLINLPDSADMRKAYIKDPHNQVCEDFESTNYLRAIGRKK